MTLRSFAERARRIVTETLFAEADPEVDRLLIGDAVIGKDDDHYRIESGGEAWEELASQARRQEGLCDCGGLLSTQGDRSHCRTCGREFRVLP